ncbi:Ig-like domain repeat protein [Nocardia sp. CDC160]|uniref:Ig-like domain repeat protein n=1 Tax=Nocardia sp. CDC160 TaxID=3112166 RepID=UPI002DC02DCF|nr:Ig-like domain repeat protein [Nocardia sp. CDC160]MEC3914836.1 Ig-like domain repeat protein [Nocardia sp. CDC160]
MRAFDPNDYRKRVLAAVERRGGIEESDAFELYDIPLEEAARLSDAEVAARVAEVWAFWQKQRDHPKYRVLVGLLVDAHKELSEPLLHTGSRLIEADRVRQLRARREAERYEMLDVAIERLVQRHGGIPAAKIPGLEDIGRMGGLSLAEIAAHIRRHRIIDDGPRSTPPAAVELSPERRQQIRKLLAEYERLLPGDPVPTLLALLGLDYSAAHRTSEIRLRAEALRARTRELPPGRVRVVLDELLVHVRDILEPGGEIVDAYLLAIVETVTDDLRPKVRAAVLVEDLLVTADFDYLLREAILAGLDHPTAERVLITLTDELGTVVEGREHLAAPPHSGPSITSTQSARVPASSVGPESFDATRGEGGAGAPAPERWQEVPYSGGSPAVGVGRPWEAALRAARAALRGGRPTEAAGFVADARRNLGGDSAGVTSVGAVAEEVERVLGEAVGHWRGAVSCCAGRRFVEALAEHLDYLDRRANDVPNPDARGESRELLIGRARAAVIEAGRMFEAVPPGPPSVRLRAVLDVLAVCADHPEALAALAELQVGAPGQVSASRKPDGTVVIAWTASATAQVEYRVKRLQEDGSWRVVGRTRGTALEDGGALAGPVPVYGVVAAVGGQTSEMARSDGNSDTPPVGAPTDTEQPSGMPTVRGLTAQRGLLVFEWPTGITEVMVVARPDAPPIDPEDPHARRWKVTNMRYEIDGGVRIPAEIPRPCHVAIASCRREPSGTLTVATAFAPTARIRWVG